MPTKKVEKAGASVGRGGARPGAGRPKSTGNQLKSAEIKAEPLEELPEALGNAVGIGEITQLARSMSTIALRALGRVANSRRAKHADVIKAANDIMTWGYGKPMGIMSPTRPAAPAEEKKPAAPKLGKKEQLALAAANPDQTTVMGKLIADRNKRSIN